MELARSIEIVHALSQGIDPLTGEALPPSSPYEQPEIIRALHTLLVHANSPARRGKLMPEQKQAANLQKGLPRNAGLAWTDEARVQLGEGFRENADIGALAARFERTRGSIIAELQRQGLINLGEARTLQVKD
ncbi:MAG: hypothetical protein OET44_14975 [Gammaproteobacteria bacterium]|nr:hypothetical protein [Gammaproteobacteria bacterium]